MKSIIYIILALSAIAILFSCGSQPPAENSLKLELVTYQKQSDGCDGVRDDNCAKIKIEFPQITSFENGIVTEKINKSISELFSRDILGGTKSNDFETVMSAFIEEYNSIITEFPDTYQSWFIERTGEVKLNKGNIFSVDFMEYSYTGGAHPNTYVEFKNFNLTNGEEIRLDEIIQRDKQKELIKIGEEQFRKIKNLTADADLGEAGFWFENNEFYLNDNFLITDSSLIFYYNNYEITAYAFGPTELEISYSMINNLIDEKSIISDFKK
jgi:hypothetical protein